MRRWIKYIAGSIFLFLAGGIGVGHWVLKTSIAKPPHLDSPPAILKADLEEREERVWLGESWMGTRRGMTTIYVTGSPFEMGFATGKLLEKHIHQLENEFLTMVRSWVPNPAAFQSLKWYIIYRNRDLSRFIPLPLQMEIYGATLGCPDPHPEQGPYYNRVLNYHAAQDISYMLIDNPLVSRAGCTAFGVWGDRTEGGHLLTGRNFDWEAGDIFGRDRMVQMFEPDDGIPFISLGWAGMVGVVSGMNREGVSVTINGAPSELPKATATPIAMVARQVLQRASNLEQAIQMVQEAQTFVSSIWLVGSAKEGKFVALEKTPVSTEVREGELARIMCSNHFESKLLKTLPNNLDQMKNSTSVSRLQRLTELIENSLGPVSPLDAAGFLRDRNLPGGGVAGFGHRGTLNPLIATHATIMDLDAGIFWAAMPPHQMGKFVAFDVSDFERELPDLDIPADPLLESDQYDQANQAKAWLQKGKQAMEQKMPLDALNAAENAEKLNPGFYQNTIMKGEALSQMGRKAEAIEAFRRALGMTPAFREEGMRIQQLLSNLEAEE